MKRLVLNILAAAALATGSAHAADRVPLAISEGTDMATNPPIATTTGPINFYESVNSLLANSAFVVQDARVPPILRLNLLAVETSTPNEIAYAFTIQQREPGGRLVGVSEIQIRTCAMPQAKACASQVAKTVEAAAAKIQH